ncbi:MAG TPA: hypothetical protein VK395_09060 [Gemmataceae bacterium]|nr:hypothetical protein [Gemmataceae bacterium]
MRTSMTPDDIGLFEPIGEHTSFSSSVAHHNLDGCRPFANQRRFG